MTVQSAPSSTRLEWHDSFWSGRFQAMASPCEILLDTEDRTVAAAQCDAAAREAERIEAKYSRYRAGSVVARINASAGAAVEVDEETAGLLDYAAQCHALSGGLFDITTGVLRRAWRFDGGEQMVDAEKLAHLRSHIGWDHVRWERPILQLPAGFEIDFGGIGKEYAADRILALLKERSAPSALVNLGGDISAAGERLWSVGIEDTRQTGGIARTVHLRRGGVATSGTTKRFVTVRGRKLGHILHPKTGGPVDKAPASVTVAARTCTEAGFWSTLAVLQGARAEAFLTELSLEFWVYR